MQARVPQDVDLEDRLVYGLTPLRFGYLVIAVLGALSLWRVGFLPAWARALPCLCAAGAGAALAWGRWRGRALDHWLLDLAVFVRRNYRVDVSRRHGTRTVASVAVPLTSIRALRAESSPAGALPAPPATP